MNPVHRDIFKAIHEGRWLSIVYRNQKDQVTKYWIGIRNLNIAKRTLQVEGLHLGKYSLETYDWIYIDSILSSQVIEGTYCPINQTLVRDIYLNPHKYRTLFDYAANLKILNYLEDCSRLDKTPCQTNYALLRYLDRDSFQNGVYQLREEQFRSIVRHFQVSSERRRAGQGKKDNTDRETGQGGRHMFERLAMNVMSIHGKRGLYVLAYRPLRLDVKARCLKPDEDITVCMEFTVDGSRESIRAYLDAEDCGLLENFEENQEKIKDALAQGPVPDGAVDDMPYVIGIGVDSSLDLHKEYGGILEMYRSGKVTVPIRAFFGDLLNRPRSRQPVPITLLDKKMNLDQLLAVNNAMKYPVAYIQGPPGTGKTNTIINTILTAFMNERTVLFASYNNHPIDGVTDKLTSLTYRGKTIPFPVIRLGNQEKTQEALNRMRVLYECVKEIPVFEGTLRRNKEERVKRARSLSELLKRYDEILDLKERKETLNRLLEYRKQCGASLEMLNFDSDLENRQMRQVDERLEKIGTITNEDALRLLEDDEEELRKYLYYISVKYISRIGSSANQDLLEILYMEDPEERVKAFHAYLGKTENVKKFQKIFPVIATTCISAYRLGEPEPQFDMTIMDEASQCNTAVSLVPILRGEKLMLVGDPQQLNPVILLDEAANQKLRRRYQIADEYDYRKNSIYKTYLACDCVSDEVLLRYHYRCNRKIIGFNNRKYYNSRLKICSESQEAQPLVYVDVKDGKTDCKNMAPAEAEVVIRLARDCGERTVGVITPFVSQRQLIEKRLKEEGLTNVSCGTVHAFQGDEKDVVIFSTALTDRTHASTYEWLKNNRELINVATSRAREKLIVLASGENLERLHGEGGEDDLYDLVTYVKSSGASQVMPKENHSRALGVKPFSTATEEAFLLTLNHALENLWLTQNRFSVEKEVAVSQVFSDNTTGNDLFYSGRFDFVVYERDSSRKFPVLVIELDGKEHFEDEIVKERDKKKQEICRAHQMELIRVENSYARRYQYVKEILETYFAVRH